MVYSFNQDEIEDAISDSLSDDYTTQNPLDTDGLEDFFSKKGAIEVMILLTENPAPFKRINDLIPASRTTVSRRLSEGVSLGLWGEDILYINDNKRIKLYRLDAKANEVAEVIREKNAYQTYMQYYGAKSDYEEVSSKIKEDVIQKVDE